MNHQTLLCYTGLLYVSPSNPKGSQAERRGYYMSNLDLYQPPPDPQPPCTTTELPFTERCPGTAKALKVPNQRLIPLVSRLVEHLAPTNRQMTSLLHVSP